MLDELNASTVRRMHHTDDAEDGIAARGVSLECLKENPVKQGECFAYLLARNAKCRSVGRGHVLLGKVNWYVEVLPQPLAGHRLVSTSSEQMSQKVVDKVTSRRSPTSDSISCTQSDMKTPLSV